VDQGFKFESNDIILCHFLPERQVIIFKNLTTEKKIQLNIELPETDELCICACLCGVHDSVAIYNDFNENEDI